MNRFAYLTSGFAVKALSNLSKAKIMIYGKENIPSDGSVIFVVNHFTRIETLILPSYIYDMTHIPIWSLADYTLFKGFLSKYFDKVGVVSTENPDRDLLIVKSLLTGEANWIIFPEGLMVKNKKIVEKGRFMISSAKGKHPPHTGAATLSLRTEFYRQRFSYMIQKNPEEAKRLAEIFQIDDIESIIKKKTYIVPVNITYYPIRSKENIINKLASYFVENIPERMTEEIMTEGTMLLSGVDMDIRLGKPIKIANFMKKSAIQQDIAANRVIHFDDPIPSKEVLRNIAIKIMQQYMSAIYSMTTVNHDHLFASIVKLIPFKEIDMRDLKRRVFLATTNTSEYTSRCGLDRMGICFHSSLAEDQRYLLTDDRFNKFREFVALAIEKGLVTEKNDMLIKDMSRFTSPFDFHYMRIDNPISVMANEVEPLTRLQRRMRRLAWQPSFLLKHRIRKYFFKKEKIEFEKDYQEFYVAGESKKKDIGMPFLIQGKSKKIGILLIHGYMSVPRQVGKLADYLAQKGVWVYAPRLKGHGTSPDDLAIRTYRDWMDSVDAGYAVISNLCERVIVGGFSTGAALALDFAARVKDVEGVFAICPPLRLQDVKAKFASAVDIWNRLMNRVHFQSAKKEFIENTPETPQFNYFRNPISGVKEIESLMDQLEGKLPNIHVPAIVVQSYNDPVVNPKGSRRIFELLGSEEKQYVLFNFDRHCIILGKGAHQVYKVIGNFIESIVRLHKDN